MVALLVALRGLVILNAVPCERNCRSRVVGGRSQAVATRTLPSLDE